MKTFTKDEVIKHDDSVKIESRKLNDKYIAYAVLYATGMKRKTGVFYCIPEALKHE